MEAIEIVMEGGVSGRQRYVKEKINIGSSSRSIFYCVMKSSSSSEEETSQTQTTDSPCVMKSSSSSSSSSKVETTLQRQDGDFRYPLLMAAKQIPLRFSERLCHEYEVYTQLDCYSPYILQCYGEATSLERGIQLYSLLLEFPQGGASLSDRIKKQRRQQQGGFPEADVIRYTRSILLGLQCIHRSGYVHCNLTPPNILICENDTPKITDFGLSQKIHRKLNKSKFIGTPVYMAPETIFSSESIEPISDVWALGCMVLEMLTGNPPWEEKFPPRPYIIHVLTFIARTKQLPSFPENASPLAIDFLSKCLVRDVSLRWTPDMLLTHPFLKEEQQQQQQQVAAAVPTESSTPTTISSE